MKIDNTHNSSWPNYQCIGGGLGYNGYIEIENCVFNSVIDGDIQPAVSYHNTRATNGESRIVITGCYLVDEKSRFQLICYGSTTKVTEAIIANCSYVNDPEIIIPESTPENISLLKWNNELRNY